MRYFSCLILLFFSCANVALAQPVRDEDGSPRLPPGARFFEFRTKNFLIRSEDQEQGRFLSKNAETMKTWCLRRWGFPDLDFSQQAQLICFKTAESREQLMRVPVPLAEIRREHDAIAMTAVWTEFSMDSLLPAITLVALAEYEQHANVRIGYWAHRGIAALNASTKQIGRTIVSARHRAVGDLFTLSAGTFHEMSWKEQALVDEDAAVCCLMIRKELGRAAFSKAICSVDPSSALGYNPKSDEFNKTYLRYVKNLSADLQSGRAPKSYLTVGSAKW